MAKRGVVVLGGGLAGVAAAVQLAEQGVSVTLLEREPQLGGRAGAYADKLADGTPFEMERGFHAFFRHYKNVRALIRRVDPTLSCLTRLDDYPLLGPDGAAESFAGLPRATPLNILELIRRSKTIRFRDLRHANLDAARAMLAFDPDRTYRDLDDTSAKAFLDSLRFPPKARQMLFDVFAHSFFNAEDDYSAAELLSMFHFYFTRNPDGLVFDVMNEPFSVALWKPMERYLAGLGVTLRLATAATHVLRDGDAFVVHASAGEPARGDALVLAVEVPALQRLVAASPALSALEPSAAGLAVAPRFSVLRLWLDRPCRADRAPFAGTTGVGLCDNISLYERFEGESRRWALAHGGSIVELHAYGLPDSLDEAAVRQDLIDALYTFYPETRGAKILEERHLVRADCPGFAPGSHARRPGVTSALPGVVLAGDFVKLPFPSALMERATSSGFLAANALLDRFGLATSAVAHGPTKGWLAPRA